SERVNSNMVIVGKSGSGKSYATKSLLTNLAADDAKIFILDPENEYTELAANLHGKFINVGNAQHGRLNPFHIITGLDDDKDEGSGPSGSYATHLQFLEEFFRQILPDCDKDAMEYLNSLIDRMYTNMGITADTDLSRLSPEDYPTFDDLYDAVLNEFQSTDNEYIHSMLRTLMNHVAKFSSGGRNANIWNGPSTVTTDENFTVFNFQSLLANRNGSIANAQMLLVLKYIDNEIIKNRDYNLRHKMNRKVVVVIDEAHVFIDTKYPIALDFMFQLAKRIRKYNGMQIVITQNIKDFVGSEEIARKSTAIINACQYSFIFSLAPNDMGDLCKLYEKAGGINESEQEEIVSAPRGQAFTVMSPQSRSTFKVEVTDGIHAMFDDEEYVSQYFNGEDGQRKWEEYLGDSRRIHDEAVEADRKEDNEEQSETTGKSRVTFLEISEAEYDEEMAKRAAEQQKKASEADTARRQRTDDLGLIDIDSIPDDPEAFAQLRRQMTEGSSSGRPFSYADMMREIRRSVREELERELEDRELTADSGSRRQRSAKRTDSDELDGITGLFSIGNDDLLDEEDEQTPDTETKKAEETPAAPAPAEETPAASAPVEAAPAAVPEAEEEEREKPFDIMSMLMQAANDMSELSPLDTMIEYDETILEITLEELMKYNAAHL
ncbi:MAG: ATP-binding protein, partial [Clostridia bacterium]|nr:ATP-binding protein [Clostridia bacterium]